MLQRDNPRAGPHFFSRPLAEFDGKIPFIVTDLITALHGQDAMRKEGIFRLSAPKHSVEALCRRLDQGRIADWSDLTDHNLLACAFKAYIRELSIVDPLIARGVADKVRAAASAGGAPEIRRAIRAALGQAGLEHRRTLAAVMRCLRQVMDAADVNLMSAYNLAVCFTPCLFERSNSVAGDDALRAVEEMIAGCHEVFQGEVTDGVALMTDDDVEAMAEPEARLEDVLNEEIRRRARKDSLIPYQRDDLPVILRKKKPERAPPPLPRP
jgi:hypothetical protein